MTKDIAENSVQLIVSWLRLGIESLGALIITVGVGVAIFQLLHAVTSQSSANFTSIRLSLARYLALALEFQLGADILSTAIAPTPREIGQLGAIALIRTALNYFLSREMKEERETVEGEKQVQREVVVPSDESSPVQAKNPFDLSPAQKERLGKLGE